MKASATSSPSGSRTANGASSAFRARKAERVFVYGTLRRGGSNHRLLKRARYLGEWMSPPVFNYFDCGAWPGVMYGGQTAVFGEVYAITPSQLRRLDVLEDYPRLYERQRLTTTWGEAWVYLLRCRPVAARRLASGDWMEKMGG